jgi:hypothetical protein
MTFFVIRCLECAHHNFVAPIDPWVYISDPDLNACRGQPNYPLKAMTPKYFGPVCAGRAASFITNQNMEVAMKKKLGFCLFSALFICAIALSGMVRRTSAIAPAGSSASGHGTILVEDQDGNLVRRQFSFSARVQADGTVQGNAVIHNPEFDPTYNANIKITCLLVDGNRASFGGTVRRTSDPVFNDEFDAAFFTVYDNGEPGAGEDSISLLFFDNVVGPETCQFIGPTDFPQIPIEAGNVQVRP